MNTTKSRFLIALLPPQEIQDYANDIKQHFAQQYNSQAAQKSPPHITLQPPFEWSAEAVTVLAECLSKFASSHSSVPITVSGFGAFAPRVIYINVLQTPELLTLQTDLMTYLELSLEIVDQVAKQRPFAPHITVAFRDLTQQNFHGAWPEFQHRMLHFEFTAAQLTLLIHDSKGWNIHSAFSFLSLNS